MTVIDTHDAEAESAIGAGPAPPLHIFLTKSFDELPA